ncbi:MAG: T9SS type A sorting domain-containing protein, partial [Saprospiraceae bacterium]
ISVEAEAMTTMAMAWETLEIDFNNQAAGTAALNIANTYDKISIFFNFGTDGPTAGEKTYYWDDVEFVTGGGGGLDQVDLPVTFEDANVDYNLTDFGGNTSSIEVDPTDPNNMVGKAIKSAAAELWAGTTMGDGGLANPIPFTTESTKVKVRVWSPDAGIPIRIKVEDKADPTISVEAEALTTVAMAWETLEVNFSNQAAGTAALNLANTYDKISIFFNFGTDGPTAGEKTYYWDDVEFVIGGGGGGGDQIDLPVTFEDSNVDYSLTDFGGNVSSIEVDPTDPNNMVGKAIKTDAAETFAGTTMGNNGLASVIPFTAEDTKIKVRVWSPDANTPVRIKVEDKTNNAISVETEVNTTVAMAWETLEFNFSTQAAGTAPLNLANTYDKITIFFNFGTDGATAGEKTYYWDDVEFVIGGGGGGADQIDMPVTFEDTNVDYNLTDFGGNTSSIETDPTDPNNVVGKAIKSNVAEVWAGTTMGNNGMASSLPFTATETKMTVRVWSPDAGTPVLLKVEDPTDGSISVETIATTTEAMTWETLEFDFTQEEAGTPALDLANNYQKVSIFFNFGTDGATAGEKTYYWDDVYFGALAVGLSNLNAADNNIKVFPNPASTELNLQFSETLNEAVQILLYDTNGRLLKQATTQAISFQLNTADLNNGTYFLQINDREASYYQKVIIVK